MEIHSTSNGIGRAHARQLEKRGCLRSIPYKCGSELLKIGHTTRNEPKSPVIFVDRYRRCRIGKHSWRNVFVSADKPSSNKIILLSVKKLEIVSVFH